ncbi:helix-turn-helix domain-containing protein [Enterobacteriaceae bacterium BIT-l23]|uniref:GlxA family transcriptional regulator n=1 Tax=Jejubacter sp. L23 TaxID=3092086 RepID=UPI0015845191|nr:helix-turn-helix domain-containing protein [Enterobacteriaceae bacterium BIT-l23]
MNQLKVALIVMPGFSPFHISAPAIIFGPVLPEQPLFHLQYCAERPGMVASEQGMFVEASGDLSAAAQADIVIVPWWPHLEASPSPALIAALREARQRGARVVGLCLGTWVLARAGLLDGRRAATHWESEADFVRHFPRVHLDTNALYVDDDGLITSAGTAASLDCCLYIVRQYYGSRIANRIARRMVIPPYREGGQAQFIERPVPETTRDTHINILLDHLRNNLDSQHSLDTLAHFVAMSRRTFTRHFQRATGMSVGEWLTAERLSRSQELLESSSHSVDFIASTTGFQSPVTFRQRFKARYGVSPSEWRRTFHGKEG